MKFLIIIPAHNEESTVLFTLNSLKNQSFQDYVVVVVNDGSTDRTPKIILDFILENPKFKTVNLEKSEHHPGAKVVRTFNAGLKSVSLEEFDIICKFDADIIFPSNYLSEVESIYRKNPKAGMVSGLVKIKKSVFDFSLADDFKDTKQQWMYENLSSKEHVRGPIKSYRKECFLAMNGLRPVLGWDNIDVMLAKMHGFEIITLKKIWVKHLRPTAYKYRGQRAEKLGEYFYNIGLSFPLAVISALKAAMKDRKFSEFLIIMRSFLRQKGKLELNANEIDFIRRLRWNEMRKKAGF